MKNLFIAPFVLAGGKSTRMGIDKGQLGLCGEPLLMRLAKLVETVSGTRPLVIGPPRGESEFAHLRFVEDEQPGAGPLAGIVTALGLSTFDWNLVIACDLPYLSAPWLQFLIARAQTSLADVVLPMNFKGLEPLCAMYHKRSEGPLRAELEKGTRRVTQALEAVRLEKIEPSEWQRFDSTGYLLKNMNTPADYEEAKRRLG
jgi:molybdopterin-guanine dinucleotide biosynthesis protein A